MKKINTTIKNIIIFVFIAFAFVACEKDFANIGSGIIGNNNFETDKAIYPVITYNQNVSPVQSYNLPSYLLGYYNDNIFGDHSASIVGQMEPSSYEPVFGENVMLDSVVLTIPYFSTPTELDEDDNQIYRLDSVFGNTPFKLSVYQNNFFLRNFNPDSEFNDPQRYYSNKAFSQDQLISPSDLESTLLYEQNEFLPSADQIILTEVEYDEDGNPVLDEDNNIVTNESQRLAPAMRILLDQQDDMFWHNLIFSKEGEPELTNLNNFSNYFRGLYIKAESSNINGSMMLLDLLSSNTSLNIYYSNDIDFGDDDGDEIPNFADVDINGDGTNDNGNDSDDDGIRDRYDVSETGGSDIDGNGIDDDLDDGKGSFRLNFTGNIVNFMDNNFMSIPEGDEENGDEKLYLKGGQGSMAIINLFNGDEEGNSPDFEDFKSENWLINEANLTFYVDQSMVDGEEPNRLFVYDLNNNTALIDYFLDQSVSESQISAKIDHLPPLVRVDDEPDGEGIKYKIRITEHINNLFLRDSTNVKLGLVVTSNVNEIDNLTFLDNESFPSRLVSGSFLSPLGTVLHGNNSPDPEKRVNLEIYYTEPDEQ